MRFTNNFFSNQRTYTVDKAEAAEILLPRCQSSPPMTANEKEEQKEYLPIYCLLLSSLSKLVSYVRKAIIIGTLSWQIFESAKVWGVHSAERNAPIEVKLSCSLVKESLSFSNLVFSNLCSSCPLRICLSSKTTGKQEEWNTIKQVFEGGKQLHRK